MIEQCAYSHDELVTRKTLFSSRIENNPQVLYHATGSQVEGRIDRDGFSSHASLVTADHVNQLATIYQRMNWSGIPGGYSTLQGFTRGRSGLRSSQVWFRESSMRSLIYAHRSFSGGEAVMSFKRAFDHLVDFATSESIRRRHLEDQSIQSAHMLALTGRLEPVVRVDVARLLEQLEPLRDSAQACTRFCSEYKYGLMYAVQFYESDIPNLLYRNGSGIMYLGEIASERIVGKATIHFGASDPPYTDSSEAILNWRKSAFAQAIRSNARSIPLNSAAFSVATRDWLGEDIAAEVVEPPSSLG